MIFYLQFSLNSIGKEIIMACARYKLWTFVVNNKKISIDVIKEDH